MERLALVEGQSGDPLPELVALALRQAQPGTDIVLVGTRPIRPADPERFGRLAAELARQASLGRLRTINVSSPELSQYFHLE